MTNLTGTGHVYDDNILVTTCEYTIKVVEPFRNIRGSIRLGEISGHLQIPEGRFVDLISKRNSLTLHLDDDRKWDFIAIISRPINGYKVINRGGFH